MGRAIDTEKDIDMLKKDVAQLKTAFDGLAATVETLQDTAPTKKSVDLHDGDKEYVDRLKEEKLREETKKETKKELVEETEA